MNGLQQITFRFKSEFEVRYLPQVPDVGDLVSHDRELWLVAFVAPNGIGMTVVCELPRGDGRRVQRVA